MPPPLASQTVITPEDFGPTGTADDHRVLRLFLKALDGSGLTGYLRGRYVVRSCLSAPLNNCRLVGDPMVGGITRVGGYDALKLTGGVTNLSVQGIAFQSDHVAAAFYDPGVVWTEMDTAIRNLAFERCRFSAPRANMRGLQIYANTHVGSSGLIEGLRITDCEFVDIGGIGCTIYNRGGSATKAQWVSFDRNTGRNLGLIDRYGMLLSLDGSGVFWTCDDNRLENCHGIGLENTGWSYGHMRDNRFRGFSRAWHPIGMSAGTSTHLVVSGCVSEEAGSEDSYFENVNDSKFEGNDLWNGRRRGDRTQLAAARFRNASRNLSRSNRYRSAGATVVLVGTAGRNDGNRFERDRMETQVATSAANPVVSAIECNGYGAASVAHNRAAGLRLRLGKGGVALSNSNGARDNRAVPV